MGASPSKDVDTEKLYDTLGVKKDATKKEIRKVSIARTVCTCGFVGFLDSGFTARTYTFFFYSN